MGELVGHSPAAVLAEAARVAGYAPSVHNTQPWRWRIRSDTVELYAERSRQLGVVDPDGRLLVVSCGAALHHIRVALAAEGWRVRVLRLPEPAQDNLLARLTLSGRTAVAPSAMRLLQTIQIRRTDRRPVTDAETSPQTIDEVRRAVEAEGARLHVLNHDDVLELASAAARAQQVETLDPQWREEIAYWAGGVRGGGFGVPDYAIPSQTPQTTVPNRNFGHGGGLPVGEGHDRAAVYAILYGDEDTRAGWLRGGEALSAGWLIATELALSVLPLSAAVEVLLTRRMLRRLLSNLGEPYLVLRLGRADPDHAGPPRTPRLPAEQIIEIIGNGRHSA